MRTKAGLTQEELGERIGVTRATIINWEKGASHPDAKEMGLLAKELKVNSEDLQTDEPNWRDRYIQLLEKYNFCLERLANLEQESKKNRPGQRDVA